jgi:NAD(P)-dependent dehydrogenase (short-subunit alcohol dehydrogenase family)
VQLTCDLADRTALQAMIDVLERQYGGCDVLINNASDCPRLTENYYDPDVLQKTLDVSFMAPYFLCGELAARMAERGRGSIINVTSINAERALPGNPAYITAKSALRLLTFAIARDFGEKGVRANNLCPGYIHTRMTDASFHNPRQHEERRSHTMLGRWGAPGDLVGPCLFLASDASAYITATDLHVDGGWLSKGM